MKAIQGYIRDEGIRNYTSLDYGCGRGTDADLLGMDKYDPNWFGVEILEPSGKFASHKLTGQLRQK